MKIHNGSVSLFVVLIAFLLLCFPGSGPGAAAMQQPPVADTPQASPEVRKLLSESDQQLRAGRPEEALKLAEQALHVAAGVKDIEGEALAHKAAAAALGRLRRGARALEALLSSAEAWKRAGEGPAQLEMLVEAGIHLVLSGDAGGQRYIEQALALGRSESRKRLAAAAALCAAGRLLKANNRLRDSGDFFRACLAIREDLVPDSLEVSEALHELGWLGIQTSFNPEYKQGCQRSLAIRMRLAPESSDVAQSLLCVGTGAIHQAELAKARDSIVEAIRLFEKAGPQFDSVRARALNNLGIALTRLRELRAAADYARQAAEIMGRIAPGSMRHVIYTSGRGDVAYAAGQWEDAERYYRAAIAIEERNDPASVTMAQNLDALARVMFMQVRLQAAREYEEHALAIYEKCDDCAEVVGFATMVLGLIVADQGHFELAESLHRRAISLQEMHPGENHPHFGFTLEGLASVLEKKGDLPAAFEAALRAERLGRDQARLAAQSLGDREAIVFAGSWASGRDLLLSLASRQDAALAKPVMDSLIHSRGLVLDEMAARHRVVEGTNDRETARLARELGAARARLARLVVLGPGAAPERFRDELSRAQQDKETVERTLAAKSLSFRRELDRGRIGLKEVVSALPRGSALVAFSRYGGASVPQGWPLFRPPRPAPAYVAFVLDQATTEVGVVSLGPAEQIDLLVAQLRESSAKAGFSPERAMRRNEAEYRLVASRLKKRIWDPVSPYLTKAKRVFIVPDGALNLVNFAALPTGQSSYLVETGPQIHYLSAERDLVPLPEQERKGEGILTVGAPAFDEKSLFAQLAPQPTAPGGSAAVRPTAGATFRGSRSACGNFQTMRFEPLPASARETQEIAALWQRPAGTLRGGAATAVQLTGAEASEAAFKQQAPGKRVLHLATHGFFIGGKCQSALDAAAAGPFDVATVLQGENPLLLSGLALAGANHRQAAGPEEEDGILTAEEIASLDLSGVEWAVLSACDTGVGEVKAGEGVLGLRRAFQVAGARTLIMSLWPVEDTAARAWMSELYRARLTQGQTTIDAVHQASLKTLRARRAKGQSTHPFYWAGFVAAGDWR